MNRFYVDEISQSKVLADGNHTHIAYSLRLRAGQQIELFCGDGYNYRYKIVDIKKHETFVELIEKSKNKTESSLNMIACTSIIKHDKMSLIYQKLSELGVNSFVPLVTEFSQGSKKDFNIERYQKICIEACKQCGRSVLPLVREPLDLAGLIPTLHKLDLVVFAYEKAELSLKEFVLKVKASAKKSITNVGLLIGPEGGFSTSEVKLLETSGFEPVSLGKRILRAETAAIATASMLYYELEAQE